jgi:outer membrane protein assembly factor BamB
MKQKLTYFMVLLTISFISYSQEIYQWRGPLRNGMFTEENLLKSLPESGPEMVWFSEAIGDGYGAPTATGDMVLVNGEIDSISYVFAFDLKGNLIWKTTNGKEYTGSGFTNKFAGSRSAPTVVNNLVYACSGNGRIICLEIQTGKEIWATNMVENLNGIMPKFGYSESLLVDEKNVYCFPGGVPVNAAALDRKTGEVAWTSKALGDTICYTSPLLIKLPTRNIVVTFSNYFLMGFDAQTGELLWNHKQENVRQKQQCNTPIFDNGYIYYIAGDGNGAVKLELSADGKSIKEIWRNQRIRNNFNGFLKIDNHIISSDKSQRINILDENTGQIIDSLKVSRGALISADSMLYCYSDNGDVNLISLNGTKMEVVSKFKCEKGTKEHFAHPAIKNGVLYIRHGKALMAFKIGY